MRTNRIYQDNLPLRSKLARLVWTLFYSLLFRPSPPWALRTWRIVLLRAFGAKIGKGCRIDPSCRIWAPWNLSVGDYVALAKNVDCYCVSRIKIGTNVAVSQRSFLCTASHDISSLTRPLIHKPIHIQDHVWVCAQAFVGPGVTVGEGAIVGACAVVTKDVVPWTIVAGNPARFIKKREIIQPSTPGV
jgi:putative colanic acid biosynthesis acetyltransferase WcaF